MVSQTHEQSTQTLKTSKILDCKSVLACLQDHLDTIKSFRIQSLALFGSIARNEATPTSDLDFLVEFEGPATFDRYMDLKFFLEDLFERPVDLVTKRSLKPQISQTVLEEAIRVA
jgi:predicted nucleotidyltransferase